MQPDRSIHGNKDWPKKIYANSKVKSTKRDGEAPTSAGVLWSSVRLIRRCTNIRGGFVQERALIPGLLPSSTGPSVLSESTGRWRVHRGFLSESLFRLQGTDKSMERGRNAEGKWRLLAHHRG